VRARGGPRAPGLGLVAEFDEERGLGWVQGDDGRRYRFHCTALSDGTRHVEVGRRVVFAVVPGHGGQFEARSVTVVGPLP